MHKHISAAAMAFFAIAAVVFFSCRQNDDAYKYMSETLHKYIGNELEIPYNYHLLDREYGLDFYDADYIIVHYVSTDGCTPCHLRLPYWYDFNNRLDTLSNASAISVLIVNPDTVNKVADFIRSSGYQYPVIIDTLGNLSKMNDLPDESFLHTFLIDREGTIKGVGDPVVNEKISALFFKIITGRDSDKEDILLTVNSNKLDIGTVPYLYESDFEFIVQNRGQHDYEIESIRVPCNCIEVTTSTIKSFSTQRIKIHFKALSGRGIFHYPIKIKYKGLKTPLIIHLYGQVIN